MVYDRRRKQYEVEGLWRTTAPERDKETVWALVLYYDRSAKLRWGSISQYGMCMGYDIYGLR